MRKPSQGRHEKFLQLFTLLVLTLQNTALVLFTKSSYRATAAPYIASTVVVCSEFVKFVASCFLVVVCTGSRELVRAFRTIPSSAPRLALPSVLYVLQNNLLFEGVRLLSPTVYMVCSQSKILTSALFSVLMLKTKISHQKMVSLCSLTMGMILAQREQVEGNSNSVHNHTTLKRQSTTGVTFVLAAALTSGFAGTYLERMYKEGSTTSSNCSIWYRNAQLALFSLPSAFLTSYARDSERISILGPFHGYDAIIIIVIALQALGGLVTAAVMRYASNVLKCFAVSASICNCVVVSFLVEGRVPSYAQVLGIIMVIWSTFSYVRDIH